MALPGTQLARSVLNNQGLECYKLYTQKRARDRSYKIYGCYPEPQLVRLMAELKQRGAQNVRAVTSPYGWAKHCNGGIRFEY